jgi:hypothetical protein
MDGVSELGAGKGLAPPHNLGEAPVCSHLPDDLDRNGRNAAAGLKRARCQPGPDHETILDGITRRDPQLEGEVCEKGIGPGPPGWCQARDACGEGEKKTPAGWGRDVGHETSS